MTAGQADTVWTKKVEAEVRSLYFAELTSRYALRKQIITGLSFFLSSAAAGAVIGKMPWYVPVALSAIVAAATAYSIAVGLDRRVTTLAKLHAEWNSLAEGYDNLWHAWFEDGSDSKLEELTKKGREASTLAATDAPYDEELMKKWGERVYESYEGKASGALATA